MSTNGYDEPVGIKLLDGPHAGWNDVYSGREMGGWPLPERIAAFTVEHPLTSTSVVAIARVDRVPDEYKLTVTYYHKVTESKLEAPAEGWTRGAAYEVDDDRTNDL